MDLFWDMGHHARAHSASEKVRKWAIGAIVAGIFVLIGSAVYLLIGFKFYLGYLQEHSTYAYSDPNNYYSS